MRPQAFQTIGSLKEANTGKKLQQALPLSDWQAFAAALSTPDLM